jgi:hypothetical protein
MTLQLLSDFFLQRRSNMEASSDTNRLGGSITDSRKLRARHKDIARCQQATSKQFWQRTQLGGKAIRNRLAHTVTLRAHFISIVFSPTDSSLASPHHRQQAVQHAGRHVQRRIHRRVVVKSNRGSRWWRFGVNIETIASSTKAKSSRRAFARAFSLARSPRRVICCCDEKLVINSKHPTHMINR